MVNNPNFHEVRGGDVVTVELNIRDGELRFFQNGASEYWNNFACAALITSRAFTIHGSSLLVFVFNPMKVFRCLWRIMTVRVLELAVTRDLENLSYSQRYREPIRDRIVIHNTLTFIRRIRSHEIEVYNNSKFRVLHQTVDGCRKSRSHVHWISAPITKPMHV